MSKQSNQSPQPAQSDGPRIYVACLAAYNNGHLHGQWIDANQDTDDMHSEISAMLATSPIPNAEEFAIHDYDGFEGAYIGEYTSIETVVKLAEFIAEHGELGGKLLEHFSGNLEDAEAAFEHYAGQHRSPADFAQELIEETTQIPQSLIYYVDYVAMARDMELNSDVFTIELGFEDVHVFWAR